jgi:ABC-type amino acid transport substrate-binding protein
MLAAAGAARAADTVTVGAAATTSDAPIYIADKKGFFKEQGIDVKVTDFRSAADMVAPLGAGQLDAGAGSASAGLYNAVARGIKIKIVADKASSPPGYGATKILVRKDHVESGRYKEAKDLKGMKFAMNAPGVSNTATLNALLKSVGLQYSDVETVEMPFPDHVAALKNKSVDASASVEPGPTIAIRNGFAVLLKGDDEIDPQPSDRGAALFRGIRQQEGGCGEALHARLPQGRALLQWRARERKDGGSQCRRGHRHPRRLDANQGPGDLQVDHADRHEPGRQSQHGEPRRRLCLLQVARPDPGRRQARAGGGPLLRRSGGEGIGAIPEVSFDGRRHHAIR